MHSRKTISVWRELRMESDALRYMMDQLAGRSLASPTQISTPPTDVYETEEYYLVRVEIAGMREEEFDITYQDGTLVIAGMRVELAAPRRAYHQMEIRYGPFATVLQIRAPIEVDGIEAEYEAGFLTVRLPKKMRSLG